MHWTWVLWYPRKCKFSCFTPFNYSYYHTKMWSHDYQIMMLSWYHHQDKAEAESRDESEKPKWERTTACHPPDDHCDHHHGDGDDDPCHDNYAACHPPSDDDVKLIIMIMMMMIISWWWSSWLSWCLQCSKSYSLTHRNVSKKLLFPKQWSLWLTCQEVQ